MVARYCVLRLEGQTKVTHVCRDGLRTPVSEPHGQNDLNQLSYVRKLTINLKYLVEPIGC
jgi:hypothetical protein